MHENLEKYLLKYNVTDQTLEFLGDIQRLYRGGQFTKGAAGETLDIEDPSSGLHLAKVARAETRDVDLAVAAAKQAFEDSDWSRISPTGREKVICRLADLMEENRRTLAEIEALDAGKAISGCDYVDVASSIDTLRYMAGWANKIEGHTRNVSVPGEHIAMTMKEPVGVVGAIVPWNWPLSMAIWKIAAPLAVGCTVVLKPAEITPLSMLYVCRLAQEAGLPPGVLNVIPGQGSTVGAHLVSHPDVKKISFTGSTLIGKKVGAAATENLAHVTLELGGKSPMIAFEDADISRIVEATQNSIFFNAGQVCSAGSRLYVHSSIYDETVAAIAETASEMVLGDTLAPETTMGPLISEKQRDSVLNYIDIGKNEGATLYLGGKCPDREGYYIEPTIFTDCTNDMRIVQEEIFGPVLCVIPFETEEEAIHLANDNIYGLAGSVFTKDVSRAMRVVKRLKAGSVWINTHDLVDTVTPFGGVKQSGIGKDLGPEQLENFLETKSVWIAV